MPLYYTGIALLSALAQVSKAQQTCSAESGNSMYTFTAVRETNADIQESYFSGCRDAGSCNVELGELTATSNRVYTQLGREVAAVARYDTVCASSGGAVCKVDIDYELNGPNGLAKVKEVDKPICFTPLCVEADVELMNPYYNPCVLANAGTGQVGSSCVATIQDVTCPANRVTANSTDPNACANSLPGEFTQQNILRQSIVAAMDARCASSNINGNRYCSIETSDAEFKSESDFSSFAAETPFSTFATTCVQSGGIQCEASYNFEVNPAPGISYTDSRTAMPICVPKTCSTTNSDLEGAVDEIVRYELSAGSGFEGAGGGAQDFEIESVCQNPSACNVQVKSISCANSPEYIPPPTSPPGVVEETEVVESEAEAEVVADEEVEEVDTPSAEATEPLAESAASIKSMNGGSNNMSLMLIVLALAGTVFMQ